MNKYHKLLSTWLCRNLDSSSFRSFGAPAWPEHWPPMCVTKWMFFGDRGRFEETFCNHIMIRNIWSWIIDIKNNYFTSSDPHHDMLGGGCQVRVVIENMMGRMENLRTLISGFLGLVILVRWALVTMFLSWTTQTGCRIHRTYVSLIGSGEGRHTTHLLKCVPLLSTSQTDWKQSSDVLSDISFDILSDISSDIFFWHIFWHSFWHIFWHSFWHLSDISFDILSDKSFDTLSDISSDISFHMLSDISSDILSDISKPKPNIHSFTQKAALQTLYLPHTTQQK